MLLGFREPERIGAFVQALESGALLNDLTAIGVTLDPSTLKWEKWVRFRLASIFRR